MNVICRVCLKKIDVEGLTLWGGGRVGGIIYHIECYNQVAFLNQVQLGPPSVIERTKESLPKAGDGIKAQLTGATPEVRQEIYEFLHWTYGCKL